MAARQQTRTRDFSVGSARSNQQSDSQRALRASLSLRRFACPGSVAPPNSPRVGSFADRRGLTLVELLVVAAIVVLLTAVAVPRLKPAIEEGRVREASRQLNAFIAMVKSQAVRLGRPVGIWIERSEPGSNVAFDVYMAEMPQPYSGDSEGATVAFRRADASPNSPWVARGLTSGDRSRGFFLSDTLTADPSTYSSLVDAGESFVIRLNYRNPAYVCRRGFDESWNLFTIQNLNFRPPAGANGDAGGMGVPYQVYRNPVRSMARPLQLDRGVIIDLEYSGMGLDLPGSFPTQARRLLDRNNGPLSLSRDRGMEFAALNQNDDSPVIVMFNPGGTVERVVLQGQTYAPSGTVHILIGEMNGLELDPADNTLKTLRAESLPEAPNPVAWSSVDDTRVSYSANLASQSNIWVSIGHRTGSVTSSPNGWQLWHVDDTARSANTAFLLDSLRWAREFGQRGEAIGGR